MPEADPPHGANDPLVSIGVLARQVGLSVSAVRKYENDGLILAHRTDSGHRLFSYEDIGRVRNIQHLIQELGLNTEGIRRMQALLPCWDLLPCSEETRKSCPAYQDTTRPCWTIKGLDCVDQGNECRQCVVYRFGSLCTEDIKHLLQNGEDSRDACAAMKELMHRRRHFKDKET
ncbi:MAG: MerR family transcriptional regulator [Planctomycetota bacterium]|jgi:MerR family transcriptional regulator/heat shock protein HspR